MTTPPPSSAAHLYHDLLRVSRALRAGAGAGGLTAGSASALWTIVRHSPLRLSEIAERESVAAPTMSRIVAALENDGYVLRSVDPADGRARLFSATDAGVALITSAGSRKAQVLATALDGLSDDEQDRVRDGLGILARALTGTNSTAAPSDSNEQVS